MKKTAVIVILIMSMIDYAIPVSAQDQNYRYGFVTEEEIRMESCSYDKDADAVVLFDIGKVSFSPYDEGFEIIYERTCRIKVLKESGIGQANRMIPLYNHEDIYEKIDKLEGNSWNMKEGKLVASGLSESNCFTARENMYWTSHRFAMPDVQAGTIIEFHYVIRSNYIFHFRDWEFQSDIPVNFSTLDAYIIPFYEYMFLFQGKTEKMEREEFVAPSFEKEAFGIKYKEKVYRFTMKNVPAFEDTDFISSKDDFIAKIDFQLSKFTRTDGVGVDVITTWPKMIKDLLADESFGRYIRKAESVADKVLNVDSVALLQEPQRLNAVISFIKDRYQFNGINSRYASASVQDFLRKKSGTSGDINLLATGLLRAAGLDAFPVILSTRDNGRIKYDYPFMHFFNYVVIGVKINDKIYLADGTEPLLNSYKLPVRCINDRGLVVKDGEVTWLDLSQRDVSIVSSNFKTEISDDGLLSNSEVLVTSVGYEALKLKKAFGEDKKALLEELRKKDYETDEADLRFVNFKSYSSPYSLFFKASLENDYSGNRIFVSPFLNQPLTVNPLRDIERKVDIDFMYPFTHEFESQLKLPSGFSVSHLPEAVNMDNELFGFTYTASSDEQGVKVKASCTFKKGRYTASQYRLLRFYYETIIKKLNEKILIVKA